jgi:fumarate reductase flavoprotein subunit
VARLPDPLGAVIVFDQAIWDGPPGRGHTQPPNPLLPEAGGTLHRAGMCGRLRVGKRFLHVRSIGRCGHVFGV